MLTWVMLFSGTSNRVCQDLMAIRLEGTFVSVHSQNNPQLLFSMCGFEVQILLKIQTLGGEQSLLKDAIWNLTDKQIKECTAQAFLCVSDPLNIINQATF